MWEKPHIYKQITMVVRPIEYLHVSVTCKTLRKQKKQLLSSPLGTGVKECWLNNKNNHYALNQCQFYKLC